MMSNNAIHGSGGGIWVHNLSLSNGLLLNVMSSIFNDNTAGIHGGIMYINDNNIDIRISNSSMVSNKALLGDGGCISSRSYINMNMTYNDITSNTAGNNGGCMSFDDNIEINIINNIIKNNTASISGGVIYANHSSRMPNLIDSQVLYNTALNGNCGAFCTSLSIIRKCNIEYNVAHKNGGFAYSLKSFYAMIDILDTRMISNLSLIHI